MSEEVENSEAVKEFLACTTQAALARIFGTSLKRLRFHLYSPKSPNYSTFYVRKASGGHREISSPPGIIALWQRALNDLLAEIYKPKQGAHGFVRGRSILSNASEHAGKRLVLNLDLREFFPSIHFGRVRGLFCAPPFNFPLEVASTLAQLATYQGKLPQGASTSPVISNFICRKLDNKLARLAKRTNCTFTRFADDITFSTNKSTFSIQLVKTWEPEIGLLELGDELKKIIADSDFSINPQKTRIAPRNRRQEVTGLRVNKEPNLSKFYFSRIRALLHDVKKLGLSAAQQKFNKLDAGRMTRLGLPPSLIAQVRDLA